MRSGAQRSCSMVIVRTASAFTVTRLARRFESHAAARRSKRSVAVEAALADQRHRRSGQAPDEGPRSCPRRGSRAPCTPRARKSAATRRTAESVRGLIIVPRMPNGAPARPSRSNTAARSPGSPDGSTSRGRTRGGRAAHDLEQVPLCAADPEVVDDVGDADHAGSGSGRGRYICRTAARRAPGVPAIAPGGRVRRAPRRAPAAQDDGEGDDEVDVNLEPDVGEDRRRRTG